MLKLCRVTKVKLLFLVVVNVFNLNLFKFLSAILERGLLISAASSEALLPKDVSWIFSVKSQGFFFILMNGNPEYSFVS